MIDSALAIYEQASALYITLIAVLVLFVWFLPAIIALFLNPKHAKYIALACIPAGLSFIAWGGVMMWALTGKVFDKYKDKVKPVAIQGSEV